MMNLDNIDDITINSGQGIIQDENSQINISDVIEVIQTTDPNAQAMFKNELFGALPHQQHQLSPNGDIAPSPNHIPAEQPTSTTSGPSRTGTRSSSNASKRRSAYVKIIEQPASKALRFRYECEGRCAGSIPGINSMQENKTFPSIQIVGYKGRAVVVVSCVTKDTPYRAHPHNLVGKEGCKKGVCTLEINSSTMSVSFSSLGIQCVKKKDIEEALRVREEIRVDPYRQGFAHRSQPSSLDLNSVRLCFQVFLESDQPGRFTVPLAPVVSDPIYDKKAMSDLVICKLSHTSCSVAGGTEMILLCEKVAKEDISVRFFEEDIKNDRLVWEAYGDFTHTNVHKQVAISFRTPKYQTLEVDHSIKCYIQLKRPSDGIASEPLPFEYLPLDSDPIELKRKRIKIGNEANLYKQLGIVDHNFDGRSIIKTEPMDNNSLSPYYYGGHNYGTSPNPASPYYPPNVMPIPSPTFSPSYSPGINQSNYHEQHQQQQQQQKPPQQFNNFDFPSNLNHDQQQQQQQPQQSSGLSPDRPTILPSLLNNLSTATMHTYENPQSINVPISIGTLTTESSGAANLSRLLDMDSKKFAHIDSADLAGIWDVVCNAGNPSEPTSLAGAGATAAAAATASPTPASPQQLQQQPQQQQQLQADTNSRIDSGQADMDQDNMTDSFTRFAINDLH